MSIIKQYTNYNNICLSKTKIFSQNVGYKVFEINELINYVIEMSLIKLKNKYRPQKIYNLKNEFIQEYFENQIYLNPYFQIFKIIEISKKMIIEMKICGVYDNNSKFNEKYYKNLNLELYSSYLKNKYEYALLKIYPYRNSIYFDKFNIDDIEIDVTNLDPKSLDNIFDLIPDFKIQNNIENKEYNMDLEHPYFQNFCYNTKKFYIYLLEYQMLLQEDILNLCKDYLYNYIIDYVENLDIKPKHITYYLNDFNKDWNIIYNNKMKKNRITFSIDLKKDYMRKTRAEYKFPYNINFNKIEKKSEISIEDICEYTKKKYGCVLNFGHDKYFEVPYMDFIDDYKIFLKE